ncbi:uncharacterized protein [Amphiura filiformis]
MISYNWECQEQMIKVKNKLKQAGYKVWMDIDSLEGSLLEGMGKAVEGSAVVLVCFSKAYQASTNCRTEAEYAYNLKVPIIPLKVESDFKATGWLGALLASKLYYRMDTDDQMERNFPALLRALGTKGRVQSSTNSNGTKSQEVTAKETSSNVTEKAPASGQKFHTSNQKGYNWCFNRLPRTFKIRFKMKAKHDLHIGLSPENRDITDMYEICVGGEKNKITFLRRQLKAARIGSKETPNILDPSKFVNFTLEWDGRTVRVSKEGFGAVIEYTDPSPMNAAYLGFTTGWGSEGDWEFFDLKPR